MKKTIALIMAICMVVSMTACDDSDSSSKKDKSKNSSSSSQSSSADSRSVSDDDEARYIYSAANTAYLKLETDGLAPADGNVTVNFDSPDTSNDFVSLFIKELGEIEYKGECIIHLKNDTVFYVEDLPAVGGKGVYPREEAVKDPEYSSKDSSGDEASSIEEKPLTDEERVDIQNSNATKIDKLILQYLKDEQDKTLEEKQYWSDDGSALAKYVNDNLETECVWTTRLTKGLGYKDKDKIACTQVTFAAEDFDSHYIGQTVSGAKGVFKGTIRDITIEPLVGYYDRVKNINKDGELV